MTTIQDRPPIDLEQTGISTWRMVRRPAEGEIVSTFRYDNLEVAEYARYGRDVEQREYRILLSESLTPMSKIRLTRLEGPRDECDKPFDVDEGLSLYCGAENKLWQWGRSAPEVGCGYDKCRFQVYWKDGSMYEGRFDLNRGGTEGGESFRDSFRYRVFFYAGLVSTPYAFRRDLSGWPGDDSDDAVQTARSRYLCIVNQSQEAKAFCRGLIAGYAF